MKVNHLVILLVVVLASGVMLWAMKDELFEDEELPPGVIPLPCCMKPEATEAAYKACQERHRQMALEEYRRKRRAERSGW